jgi:hypothetical protein
VRLLFSVPTSPEAFAFIDFQGFNDCLTATIQTPRYERFRGDIIKRDGRACVVTQVKKEACDTVHLIPRSKGDEVRFVVSSYNYLMLSSSILQE